MLQAVECVGHDVRPTGLPEAIILVLKDADDLMSVASVVAGLRAAGYKSNARHFQALSR